MKPVEIRHGNMDFFFEKHRVVVVEIALTDEDKDMIHNYHISSNGDDYDKDDVSLLAYIDVENGKARWNDLTYNCCYYPEDFGEHDIRNDVLPKGFTQECVEFVQTNYIGHEDQYECS